MLSILIVGKVDRLWIPSGYLCLLETKFWSKKVRGKWILQSYPISNWEKVGYFLFSSHHSVHHHHFVLSTNNEEFGWAGHPQGNKSVEDVFREITTINGPEDLFDQVYLRMMDLGKISIDTKRLPIRDIL